VADWIAVRTRDEVMAEAERAQVTFTPMYEIYEMVEDEHVRATEMIAEVDDDDFGKIRMPNVLFRMSRTPGSIRWTGPKLGDATEAILNGELGIDKERIETLRSRGVVF
jgi:crotonobetainyl-CoA:carnitine CoA-transferase CaiB-like acyl-CoA transferase